MTKFAQVVFIFILTTVVLFSFVQISFAYQTETSVGKTISFGELLKGSSSQNIPNTTNVLGVNTDKVKELLDNIDTLNDSRSLTNFILSPTPSIPILKTGDADHTDPLREATTPIPPPVFISNKQNGQNQYSITNLSLYSQSILQFPTYNRGLINQNPNKTTYTLAVLGDSMVDTLGHDLPHLRALLKENFPKYSFGLLNYGQGGTDMDSGLFRLTNATTYLGVYYPPLLSYKPDILVVESFAYNHWGPELSDLNRQWLTIAKIIDTVKANSPDTQIILAASIAPNAEIYGDGAINWSQTGKWQATQVTKAYLQNMINFATSQGYPLADAYTPSLGADGNGLRKYINGGDNLHPSGDGGLLFSQKIIEAINKYHLIPN